MLQAQVLERSPHPGMQGAAACESGKDVRTMPGTDLFQVRLDESEVVAQVGIMQEVFDMAAFFATVKRRVGAQKASRFQIP